MSFLSKTYPFLYPLGFLSPERDFSSPDPLEGLLEDSNSLRTYLFIPTLWDSNQQSLTKLYYSNDGFASGPGDTLPDGTPLAHQLFRARLAEGGVFNVESRVMSNGVIVTNPTPSYGNIKIILADDDPQVLSDLRLLWRNAILTCLIGRPSWPLSQFTQYASGIAAELIHDSMTYSVSWGDLAQKFQAYVQKNKYLGMGGAVRLNGTSAYITGSLSAPVGPMTIEASVRPATSAATIKRIVCWRNGVAAGARSINMGVAGVNLPNCVAINDAGVVFILSGSVPLPVGIRSQVAMSLDPVANLLRLIVNGITVAYTATTGTFNTVLSTVFIGRNETGSEFLDADNIDEIRIHNVARADDWLLANGTKEISSTTSGLYAYYKGNDQAPGNVTLFDSVSVPHNLTLSGSPPPQWVGTLTGGPSIAGKYIPRALGRYTRFEPVLVDEANQIYQINDGSIQSIDLLEHKGLAAYVYDGDVADLYAGTFPYISAGHWRSNIARGLFQLNATVSGHLVVTGHGDNTGVLGYVEDPASLVKKLALETPTITNANLDLSNLALIASLYNIPVWCSARLDPVTIDSLMIECMSNIMGWRTITRNGLLTVGVLGEPNTIPDFTLDENDPAIDGVTLLNKSTPVKQTNLGYARYGLVQGPADLAVTSNELISDLGLEWRSFPTLVDFRVVAGNTSAPTWERNTSIVNQIDVALEANREQLFWSVERWTYKLVMTQGLHIFSIGQTVKFTANFGGFQGSFSGIVVAFVENVPMELSIEIIGPAPLRTLITDSGFVMTDDLGNAIVLSS